MDLKGVHFPMQGPGGKFIGKETFLGLPKKEQEDLLKKVKPVKQVRGPGGKFVSKKQEKSRLETVEVNGRKVRKFDYEGKTYYCLEDVLAAAEIKSPIPPIEGLAEVEIEKKGKNEKLNFATKTQIIVLQSVMGDKILPEVLDFLHA